MTSNTFKSSLISIALHACVVILGSLAIYQAPMTSLELSGVGGRGAISFGNMNFISKRSNSSVGHKIEKNKVQQTASASSSSVSSSIAGGSTVSSSMAESTGSGNGVGNGNDFDQGRLFSQIKGFFEARLGSTLNINVEQLIKIKVKLGADGEILSADLVQGKLDFLALKKVLSVAKNIPLKSFWKSASPFPQELVIPLILTPS